MAIRYTEEVAVFEGVVKVEEAEDLLQWIQSHPDGKADFSGCTHLHAADLQVVMAAGLEVLGWPQDDNLKAWLTSALAV